MSLYFKTVQTTLEAIENGSLTISEVLNSYIKNIGDNNGSLNAIISQTPDSLIEKSLKRLEKSKKSYKNLPPLSGLPIAVKDLENTQGLLTTCGSPIFQTNIPKSDSPMVRNLKRAGCIIIGKTNVPEFGIGSQTFNKVFGPTRNPININLTSGGSSGGAAAAVASGMLPFADGSDMMGSLRNPAAFCSIYGFRPTPTLIPVNDPQGNLPRLSTLGGLARTTKCLTYLLDAQRGSFNNSKSRTLLFSELVDSPLTKKEIRIAWLGTFNGSYIYEPEIEILCQNYLKSLSYHNVKIDDFSPKFSAEQLWESWTTLRCQSIKQNLGPHYYNPKTKRLLKPEILWEIEKASSLTNEKVKMALDLREEWIRFLKDLFQSFDFLMLPSAQVFPFSIKCQYPSEINGTAMDTYHRWMEVVIPASLAGLPTMSIPCGHSKKGLPMGIQLMGNFKDDLNVLKISHFFEKMLN